MCSSTRLTIPTLLLLFSLSYTHLPSSFELSFSTPPPPLPSPISILFICSVFKFQFMLIQCLWHYKIPRDWVFAHISRLQIGWGLILVALIYFLCSVCSLCKSQYYMFEIVLCLFVNVCVSVHYRTVQFSRWESILRYSCCFCCWQWWLLLIFISSLQQSGTMLMALMW